MARTNRVCKICGKKYYFCPNCNENLANPKPSWYESFDSENCKNIFAILVDNFLEKDTNEVTKTKLSDCDLTDIENFDEDTRKQIEDIIGNTPTESVVANETGLSESEGTVTKIMKKARTLANK